MKIEFISDYGYEIVDSPTIPRVGEKIDIRIDGHSRYWYVKSVIYTYNTKGEFEMVTIHLE